MQTSVTMDKTPGAEERPCVQTETAMHAGNGYKAQLSKQSPQHLQEISEGDHKARVPGYVPTYSPKWFEGALGFGDKNFKLEEPSRECTIKHNHVAVSELQKTLTEQAARMMLLQKENADLHQQNDHLCMELSNMRKKLDQFKDQFKQATSFSSESRLHYMLCDNSSSMNDQKLATSASDALLSEALEGSEVVQKAEEEMLFLAILPAQEADVDTVDLEEAEEKLETVYGMTRGQHAAKRFQAQKKTAFTLVKEDDVSKSKKLIDDVHQNSLSLCALCLLCVLCVLCVLCTLCAFCMLATFYVFCALCCVCVREEEVLDSSGVSG